MEDYTPLVVIVGVALVAAWKFGLLAKLTGRLKGGTYQPTRYPPPPSSVAMVQSNPTDDLSRYDSYTLGMAYQAAIKRESDQELQHQMALKAREASAAMWQAPFGGPPTPGPPPGPGSSGVR